MDDNISKEIKGEISEWNEGNFKSMRLHQAQELINYSKVNPFGRTVNKWNYELWFVGIDIMLGEGIQKYNESESTISLDLKKEVEELMGKEKICFISSNNLRKIVTINIEPWKKLKVKLEELEYLIKRYNDKHGLSTKNVGTKGLF
jgi:hypothetical protein